MKDCSKIYISFIIIILQSLCLTAQNYGWSELGLGKSAFNANGSIAAICVNNANNVYAVGNFDDTASSSNRYIAMWNDSGWSETGNLRADLFLTICTDANGNVYTAQGGIIDYGHVFSAYKWNGIEWTPLTGLRMPGYANAICADKNGSVYMAGLALIGSPPTEQFGFVQKWQGNVESEIDSLAFGRNAVNTICVDTSGNLYAAGLFTDTSSHEYIAKWNGNKWSELGTGPTGLNVDSAILSICADSAGNIYAAGSFIDTNGYYYVAKWNGSSWSELGALEANGAINSICSDAAGNIYAAGNFTRNGYYYVAKWNGNSWSELGSGFGALNANGAINSICISSSGTIYAGGAFTDSSGYECVAKYGDMESASIHESVKTSFEIKIYPNPANRELDVDIQNAASNSLQIMIIDISGQTLTHQTINPSIKNELDVSALPAGLYFIQLQDAQQVRVSKFVKE